MAKQKRQERRFPYSIMYKTIDVEGHPVVMYIVDDLDDNTLAEHFVGALNREDYEYCEALAAEASSRGIEFIFP